MRDVIIVGGGLSGLFAALELEKLRISHTIIEVKNQLGGGVRSIQQDGFIIDESLFGFEPTAFPEALAINDETFQLADGNYAFKSGSQTLLDALVRNIHAPKMMQMAVSSIGKIEDRYAACLENGLLLDTKSIIVAAPARFAERMFYGYIPEISEELGAFEYDTVTRFSLGFRQEDVRLPIVLPPDMAYVFGLWTTNPHRVPEGHILIQFGIRVDPARHDVNDTLQHILRRMKLPEPVTQHISYWAEADLISCHDDHHIQRLENIQQMLPGGIYLIGSDYCEKAPIYRGVVRLNERIAMARQACQKIAKRLEN